MGVRCERRTCCVRHWADRHADASENQEPGHPPDRRMLPHDHLLSSTPRVQNPHGLKPILPDDRQVFRRSHWADRFNSAGCRLSVYRWPVYRVRDAAVKSKKKKNKDPAKVGGWSTTRIVLSVMLLAQCGKCQGGLGTGPQEVKRHVGDWRSRRFCILTGFPLTEKVVACMIITQLNMESSILNDRSSRAGGGNNE